MGSLFDSGKNAAKRQQRMQKEALERQRQKEQQELAEEDDAIARRKALASGKRAGRRSLIRTSETGVASGGRATVG